MRPRTKLQRQVIDYSQHLNDINKEMLEWAKADCLEHKGFATKTRVICMDCGNSFSPELVSRKKAVCPHCNTKLKIEQTRKRTDEQRTYIASAELYGEFQVIRNFELRSYHKSGEAASYYISEILQHWILSNGKREVVARRHTVNWYCDSWGGYMEIQDKSNERRYDVYPQKFHPGSVFKAEYRKYGIDKNLEGLTFLEAIKLLPKSPIAETLLKAKQYDLLNHCQGYRGRVDRYWPSIKICLRNKYRIKDASMWFDYLQLLERYGKDLRNAFYVCPKNLKKAHDCYVAKKKRDDEKERKQRDMKKLLALKKAAEDYVKDKSVFFDLKISDGTIVIVPLKSVEEFKEEGDRMHHCVFTNEYFKKKDCLILSARIEKKPIETIEINLNTLKIVQSRAVCNGMSEHHDRIIQLVKKNINLIRQRIA